MNGPVFVTGAAGFIGSNLVDRLLAQNVAVVGFDNFSTGRMKFLAVARENPLFLMVNGDLAETEKMADAMRGCATVVHLAANADVRFGLEHPRRDLEQNTVGTLNVLEAMRAAGVRDLAFASTGSVYGDAAIFPTPEHAPMPRQTSLYGASKLGAEGFISAYAEGFGMRASIFRFVSILGPRYSHGHVFDFCRQLLNDPATLRVLGDGTARKSYLAVDDCITAMLTILELSRDLDDAGACDIYNLGTDDTCQVRDSVRWICEALGVQPQIEYAGGDRGWVGDNPMILLATEKIRATGWKPRHSIRDGVELTVAWLRQNPWIFERP